MTIQTKQYTVACLEEYREIIMAEFAAVGLDSFEETATGFIAHTDTEVERNLTDEIINRYKQQAVANYIIEEVEVINWNKQWEESYEPIIIADKVLVRATFHEPNPIYPYEIIINPKMSFGTGHHETTALMMEAQLDIDHTNKKVLDAGCGTGILTILSGKLGSDNLFAFDNDSWVRDNIQENFKINGITADTRTGTVDTLDYQAKFDIILANINKNILLHDIPYYAKLMVDGGLLLLSGFYEHDLPEITLLANQNGLKFSKSISQNEWMMAQFLKEEN